jgi:hypothetical protein
MSYADGNNLCDDDGTVLGTFKSHWQACAAMIRLSDPDFKSLGGDSPDALVIEAEIKKSLAGKERV